MHPFSVEIQCDCVWQVLIELFRDIGNIRVLVDVL